MALKWQDPPAQIRNGKQVKVFLDEAKQLAQNPNRWAMIAVIKEKHGVRTSIHQRAATMANNIKRGRYPAFARQLEITPGAFETSVRDAQVYVRFVPRG